jgi:hypothetical protein
VRILESYLGHRYLTEKLEEARLARQPEDIGETTLARDVLERTVAELEGQATIHI